MGCAGGKQIEDQPLTPEQEAQLRKLKQESYGQFKTVALILLGASTISIGCGIVIISLGAKGGFPVTSCGPIWSGIIMLVAAILGLVGLSTDPDAKRDDGRSKQDYYMNASRGILWFMYAWMGMCFGYGIYTAVVCGLKDDKRCPDYPDVLLAMQIVAMVMYLVFIACSVMTCKIYRHFDRCRQKICPISAGNVHVQTTHNQYGTNNAQSQFAMQPPTYDQSMNTSKY